MGATGRRRAAWLAAAAITALGPAMAHAQEAAPAAADGVQTFPAGFFAQYNPVTAADMVSRVPGFELRDGDDRRGFGGSAGNLLINGERPSSKTLLADILKRIPANSVLKIELLSGSKAGAESGGQSQIVNVVVRQGAQGNRKSGSTSYTLGARYVQFSNRIGWIVQASQTLALGQKADLAIDLQAPNLLGRGVNNDVLTRGPTATPDGSRYLLLRPQNMGITGAAALRWRPTPQDSVNLNLQAAPTWNRLQTIQAEVSSAGAPRSLLLGQTDFNNNYTAEFGGDWEHRFSPTLSAKLITLASNTSVDQADVFQTQTFPATFVTRTQDRSTRGGERIARVQIRWAASSAHTFEFGGEGAFNFRDTSLDITNQLRGGPVTRVPLAVADARVEEARGEAFGVDIWRPLQGLTVETALNVEVSRIRQTGDQAKERSFRYFKPRFTATYQLDTKSSLRFSLARDVAQLDFAEFSSAVDFVNTSTIQGNPALVPEKAWKTRLEWETRLAPRTALTIAAFADKVQDVHDLVDIGGFDAYGNIGNGSRIGMEVRTAVPLASLGLPNAELRFNGLYQRTRVTDPVTGERRQFSIPIERIGTPPGSETLNAGNKTWAYVAQFRQNMPQLQSSWGLALVQWSGRQEYRRAELFEYVRNKPRVDLFVETTALKPVTLRFNFHNLLSPAEERVRTFYQGSRASGVVARTEDRMTQGGPEGSRSIQFQISGRF